MVHHSAPDHPVGARSIDPDQRAKGTETKSVSYRNSNCSNVPRTNGDGSRSFLPATRRTMRFSNGSVKVCSQDSDIVTHAVPSCASTCAKPGILTQCSEAFVVGSHGCPRGWLRTLSEQKDQTGLLEARRRRQALSTESWVQYLPCVDDLGNQRLYRHALSLSINSLSHVRVIEDGLRHT